MFRSRARLTASVGVLFLSLAMPASAQTPVGSGTGLLPGEVRTIAGTGDPDARPRDPSLALLEPVGRTTGVGADFEGRVHYVDAQHHVVTRIELDGRRTVVAGQYGASGFGGDGGPATSALLATPFAIAFAPDGALYIADTSNARIRRVTGGLIETVVGNGQYAFSEDGGLAKETAIGPPLGVTVQPDGRVVFSDSYTHRVRAVQPDGTLVTLAGTGTAGAGGGEGQSARSTQLHFPFGLAADATDVLIADHTNGRALRVTAAGTATTIARAGRRDGSGDLGSGIVSAVSIAVGPQRDVFITDGTSKVYKVRDGERAQVIAGTGQEGFSGDGGPATSAQFRQVLAAAVVGRDLVLSDYGNSRLRRVAAVVPGPLVPLP